MTSLFTCASSSAETMKMASEVSSKVEADHWWSVDSFEASAMSNRTTEFRLPDVDNIFHENLRQLLEAEQIGSGIQGALCRPSSHQPEIKNNEIQNGRRLKWSQIMLWFG